MRARRRLHSEANCIVRHVCLLTEMAAAHCQWPGNKDISALLYMVCLY
jgi:hypothetical protein